MFSTVISNNYMANIAKTILTVSLYLQCRGCMVPVSKHFYYSYLGYVLDVQTALHDIEKRNKTISDAFLSSFVKVVKTCKTVLVLCIIPSKYLHNNSDVLEKLQLWNNDEKPTYRTIYDRLNQLAVLCAHQDDDKGTLS